MMEYMWCLIVLDAIWINAAIEGPLLQKPLMIPPDLRLGERIDIICTLRRGSLPVEFQWHFNNRDVGKDKDQFGKVTSYDPRSSVFVIDQLKAENVGNYTCVVSNTAGTDTAIGQLLIEVPPVWLSVPPTESDTVVGAQVVLTCASTAHPPPRVTWRKTKGTGSNTVPAEEPSGYHYGRLEQPSWTVSTNGSLVINKATESDSGTFTCFVENGIGPGLSNDINLRIHVPPKTYVQTNQVQIKKGETARLSCNVSGDGPIEVTWTKKGTAIEVHPGSRFEGNQRRSESETKLSIFELVIRDTQPADGGVYSCVAKNDYGGDKGDVTMNVLEPSSSPRGVRVTEITSRTTRVSWQPPLPGNNPIIKYHLRYWKTGAVSGRQLHQEVLAGSETSTYLEGLHPGTSYTLQLLAENGVGLSEPSQVRHLLTKEEAPSGAPTDVHAQPVGSKSLEVTWKPPPAETWNGQLKGYYLGYRVSTSQLAYVYHAASETGGPGSGGATNTSRRFRIKGLQKSTTYSVVVKAYNSVGSGPDSQPVEVKTRESDPPSPPSFVITDVTSSTALIQLKVEDVSPVLQYIVEYRRPNHEWHSIHIPKDKSTFLLTRLDNSMTYEVRLAAHNEHGRGEFSNSLAFTTTERETHVGYRSAEEDVPFYFRHYFVLPVAASIVVIVTTVVFAWVCYKRVVFRQHRHLVLQQQLAGHLADAQLAVHRDGYVRPPTYSPTMAARHVHIANNTTSTTSGNPEDGYDAPWDVRKPGSEPQSGNYTRLKNGTPVGESANSPPDVRPHNSSESTC